MAETQYRLGKRKGFTVVYREVAQDSRLSLKARGLFLFMQSLPDDWKFNIPGLVRQTGAGVRQIRAALAELENVGYLVREQSHADNGTFAGNVWILQEYAPLPSLQKAPTDKAPTDNVTLQNTNLQNTPLTPQGENARVCDSDCESDAADANATADSVSAYAYANPDATAATRRAVTSRCARPRSAPKWKPERFERFWTFYSAHGSGKNRQGAVKAWDKLRADDDLINKMALALAAQVQGDMWRRGVGVPYASTWLNNRRWEDAPDDAPANPSPQVSTEVSGWIT